MSLIVIREIPINQFYSYLVIDNMCMAIRYLPPNLRIIVDLGPKELNVCTIYIYIYIEERKKFLRRNN
jgi:hypothetical protein